MGILKVVDPRHGHQTYDLAVPSELEVAKQVFQEKTEAGCMAIQRTAGEVWEQVAGGVLPQDAEEVVVIPPMQGG